MPASLLGGLVNNSANNILGNNNSCGGNIPVPGLNSFTSIDLSNHLLQQQQKSQSPTTVAPTQGGGMSPTPVPGRPREQQPQQQQQQQLPQPQQIATPSFAGGLLLGNKSDVSSPGSAAKRPRKGSGGSSAPKLQLQTSLVPINNVDNVSHFRDFKAEEILETDT